MNKNVDKFFITDIFSDFVLNQITQKTCTVKLLF